MDRNDPVLSLMVIFTAVWALVLMGTIIIFEFIVPFVIFHSILNGILKAALSTVLVVVWLFLFIAMRNAMVRRQFSK